ncbi:stage II sporulation protein M [Calidifontibacillus erzurumensis]|uniref:Stage II sporulation protein M n=1 Tax=Calidifontibacillus erzurumensis TaxID=2741433 RepID=A0A8J8KAV0_9BACI|nr:stage II sporulation protein M [Calidifontibacillus erzurumensis]NSL50438.1 stage II sporulation protein M [Calidifontibacillus erzurumensis]
MNRTLKAVLIKHFQENSSIYLFTTVLFLIGVIFGAIIVNSLSYSQKEDLYYYLSRFFGQVSNGEFASASLMFKQSFVHYAKYVGLMWILGLSIIGLPIILILLFLKGIVVGFTVGFLVNQMGWYGFLLSFVSVLPQNLLLVPAFIFIGTAAISFSIRMIRKQFVRRVNEPIFPYFVRYSFVMAGMLIIISIASSFEAYISPVLMKNVIEMIYN